MATGVITIFGLVFVSIASIITVWLFIRLLLKEYNFQKYGFKFWNLTIENICAIAGVAFFVISVLWSTTNWIYMMKSNITNSFDKNFCISTWYDPTAWTMGKFAVYLFFIVRLHSVFGGTVFAIPPNRLKIMAFIVCIPNIIYMTIIIYVLAVPSTLISTTDFEVNNEGDCTTFFFRYASAGVKQYMNIGIAVSILNQIIFSIIILRLFLKRIIYLSLTLKNETKTVLLDMELLHLAIKTANLTILAFATMFIMLLMPIISSTFIRGLDGTISTMAICLTYKSNSQLYDKLFSCCNNCYGFCIKLCFCCCSANKLPENIQLVIVQKANAQRKPVGGADIVQSQSSSDGNSATSANGTVNMEIH